MRQITAFFAWQSDTPERFNRHLIRIALADAAKRITDSIPDLEVIIDYETAGVPGTPPISDTILKKIAHCDIFIPDVSFVARTNGGKLVPNPNVMAEYGFALCAKTYVAMMPVMNTVFGPPQELPFDMGHLRYPIQYYCDPTSKPAQRRAARRSLSQELEEKLRLQIAATEPPRPTPPPFPRAELKDGPARFRAPGQPIGSLWHLGPFGTDLGHTVTMKTGPATWLRLMPAFDPGERWTAEELRDATRAGSFLLQPLIWSRICTLRAPDGIACCNLPTDEDRETNSLAFIFETGEVWAIDTWLLSTKPPLLLVGEIEKEWTKLLIDYTSLLRLLGLHSPYRWIAGLVGVNHWRLQYPPRPSQMWIPGWQGPECLADEIIVERTCETEQEIATALLPFFEEIYRRCGIRRPEYMSQVYAK
jgi:hypothetical protein